VLSGSSGNKQWFLLDARSWHRIRALYWLRCLLTIVLDQKSAFIYSQSLSLSLRTKFGDQQYKAPLEGVHLQQQQPPIWTQLKEIPSVEEEHLQKQQRRGLP